MPEPTKPSLEKQPGKQPPPRSHKEVVKETLESILVAFILAFVFRAFVVEAFVIPSGSMATTLLGAHIRYRCQDCGYDFLVNYRNPNSTSSEPIIPSLAGRTDTYSVHCPNCGFEVKPNDPDPDQSAINPPVHYGNRILVLKYLYLLHEPGRWDVVVFKSPSTKSEDYSVNFIKRLIGKPGEGLMILDGDIYTCPNDHTRWLSGNPEKPDHPEAWPWQIQRKTRAAQDSLWRIVYDNDYYPMRKEFTNPWRPSGKWQIGGDGDPGRLLHFNDPMGEGASRSTPTPTRARSRSPIGFRMTKALMATTTSITGCHGGMSATSRCSSRMSGRMAVASLRWLCG